VKILDCTLRDGGYYTNWIFHEDLVASYLSFIDQLPIDYIELGYISPPNSIGTGPYYHLTSNHLRRLKEAVKHKKIAVMIDAKKATPQVFATLELCKEYVDLVRVAIAPDQIKSNSNIFSQIKSYKMQLGVNLMYLSEWCDQMKPISENRVQLNGVDFLYLVDSHGSCQPKQIRAAMTYCKDNIAPSLGFHGHDNLSLALANSLEAIEAGASVVDSTILGIGRGAGNTKTELLIPLANRFNVEGFNWECMESVVDLFRPLKSKHQWGSHSSYVLAALLGMPQAGVMTLLQDKSLSAKEVFDRILMQGRNNNYPKTG